MPASIRSISGESASELSVSGNAALEHSILFLDAGRATINALRPHNSFLTARSRGARVAVHRSAHGQSSTHWRSTYVSDVRQHDAFLRTLHRAPRRRVEARARVGVPVRLRKVRSERSVAAPSAPPQCL